MGDTTLEELGGTALTLTSVDSVPLRHEMTPREMAVVVAMRQIVQALGLPPSTPLSAVLAALPPATEPTFLLRASDPHAPWLVRKWAHVSATDGVPLNKVADAYARAREMDDWYATLGPGGPSPALLARNARDED